MPQANKAKNVFESGKTASYDIKSIVAVQQSGKNSATFKLVVPRDAERNKRYEFEAESAKMAGKSTVVWNRATVGTNALAMQLISSKQSRA